MPVVAPISFAARPINAKNASVMVLGSGMPCDPGAGTGKTMPLVPPSIVWPML